MHKFCEDYERMFENIVASAYTYIAASKVKAMVIGMSGGIDSTITAALAQEVAKRLNHKVILEGRIIAIESDDVEMERAHRAAEAFCHRYHYVNFDKEIHRLRQRIMNRPVSNYNCYKEPDTKMKIRSANIKARLRMIALYDLANESGGLVLSTDNYTEYLLGFWTLHGDVGDFGMIQNLWKTEVYGLAEYLARKFNLSGCGRHEQADSMRECIDAMPTDGLGVTDSDFDQIYPDHDKSLSPRGIYELVDTALQQRKHGLSKHQDIVDRWKATKFKRNNPFNIPREYIIK